MTENKRYSNGSLAKWYYSRDCSGIRVISNGVDEFALNSKKPYKDIIYKELKGTNQLLEELNKLEDKIIILEKENEQLNSEKEDMQILINNISDQRNEFHRAARENANRVGELEKENKELKSELRYCKLRDTPKWRAKW